MATIAPCPKSVNPQFRPAEIAKAAALLKSEGFTRPELQAGWSRISVRPVQNLYADWKQECRECQESHTSPQGGAEAVLGIVGLKPPQASPSVPWRRLAQDAGYDPSWLSESEREVLEFHDRALCREQGTGKWDARAGRRPGLVLTSAMSGHGGRKSWRTYQRARARLIGRGLLRIVRHLSNRRLLTAPAWWKSAEPGACWCTAMQEMCPTDVALGAATAMPQVPAVAMACGSVHPSFSTIRLNVLKLKPRSATRTKVATPETEARNLKFPRDATPQQRREVSQLARQLAKTHSGPPKWPWSQVNYMLAAKPIGWLLKWLRVCASPTAGVANPRTYLGIAARQGWTL